MKKVMKGANTCYQTVDHALIRNTSSCQEIRGKAHPGHKQPIAQVYGCLVCMYLLFRVRGWTGVSI